MISPLFHLRRLHCVHLHLPRFALLTHSGSLGNLNAFAAKLWLECGIGIPLSSLQVFQVFVLLLDFPTLHIDQKLVEVTLFPALFRYQGRFQRWLEILDILQLFLGGEV